MRVFPLLTALLAGCSIDNPTGDCVPDDDGSRTCAHAPEAGDVYLPDCQAPLEREYWRVFAQSRDTAYMFPRPDAAGLGYGICDGDDADLAELFERNGICEETADPSVVNAMTPADALAISHALHERLDFEAVDTGDGGGWIDPPPHADDLAAACEGPAAEVELLGAACDVFVVRQQGNCPDIDHSMTAEEAAAMADALDTLYGIAGQLT